MKCKNCLKNKRKSNMKSDVKNNRYVCPNCGYVVNWMVLRFEK